MKQLNDKENIELIASHVDRKLTDYTRSYIMSNRVMHEEISRIDAETSLRVDNLQKMLDIANDRIKSLESQVFINILNDNKNIHNSIKDVKTGLDTKINAVDSKINTRLDKIESDNRLEVKQFKASNELTVKSITADNEAIKQKLTADNEAIKQKLTADNEAIKQKLTADNEAIKQQLTADNAKAIGEYDLLVSELKIVNINLKEREKALVFNTVISILTGLGVLGGIALYFGKIVITIN